MGKTKILHQKMKYLMKVVRKLRFFSKMLEMNYLLTGTLQTEILHIGSSILKLIISSSIRDMLVNLLQECVIRDIVLFSFAVKFTTPPIKYT